MASKIVPFTIAKLRPAFWYSKGVVEGSLLAFACATIAFSATANESKTAKPLLEPFKIFAYVFGGLMLTATLVVSTELAWAVRKAAVNGSYIRLHSLYSWLSNPGN